MKPNASRSILTSDERPLTGLSVLFVIPHTPQSVGYASGSTFLSLAAYHHEYCQVVAELGADVELVYLDDAGAPQSEGDYSVRTVTPTTGSVFGREISLSLLHLLAKTDADIVHMQGYNQPNILPAILVTAQTDALIIAQNHGSALSYTNWKHRIWYRVIQHVLDPFVDEFLSVDTTELDNLEYAGIDSEKLTHIPNAVDLNLFYPMERNGCRAELGLDTDTRYLLYVGRITQNKGVSYLIRGLSELPGDVKLLLVYSGVDDAELERVKQIADKLGIANRIRFIGTVKHNSLAFYYNSADICVFPSVDEGFGIVTLEAMACGIPVIGTTEHVSGGHLRDEENALVAETASVSSLVQQVRRLLKDEALRKSIGRCGLKTIYEQYTWRHVGEILSHIYLRSQ